MTREIPLTRGLVTLVDEEDFDWLSQWRWEAVPSGRRASFYAMRGRGKTKVKMHRLILGCSAGEIGDHADGDTLNNQRSNLRTCTFAENARNACGRAGTSTFKGVIRAGSRWYARIQVNYALRHIGSFATEEEAARAYDGKARELHGAFARLNFPEAA